MGLSSDLIAQFVKITNDRKNVKKETTVYGTIVKKDGTDYVKLDGSDIETPVSSTTTAGDGDRVTVLIKNHSAIVTGNMSAPSARNVDLKDTIDQISEFEILMSYKVDTNELNAIDATISSLKTKVASISNLETDIATIEELQVKFANLTYVNANDVNALNADIENVQAMVGKFADVSTEELESINADIEQLYAYTADFTYVSADTLHALKADVGNADIKYANIDFSNIGEVAMRNFYANSGLIKDVTIANGTITGELTGVTITGDLFKANSIVADKLLLKGTDGLYHKLNTDGVTVEAEQTDYNSINGTIITAKSIAASKISVTDLVSFGATIGGFKMTDGSIYSGVKQTIENTTRGIYLDNDGQIAFGDADKYIKFFKDTDDEYKLLISGIITANDNFKILEDGSVEAVNGLFKGTVDADNGTIGGITINQNGLSASNTSDSGVTVGYSITNSGEITVRNTGSGRDSLLYLNPDYLSMESYSTASGGDPLHLAIGSSGIFMGQTSGDDTAKIYHNGGGVLYLYGASSITCRSNMNAEKNINSTGYIMPKSGQYIHTANGVSGTNGYVKIAQIKLTGPYANQPIFIEYARRGDYASTNLVIRFASANSTDPGLATFRTDSSCQEAYLYKSATSTWDLYVKKSESYDTIDVISYYAGGYARQRMTVTWVNEMVASLPGEYTAVNSYMRSMNYKFGNDKESFITSRTGGGFDFWFTKDGMRICFDGSSGKIYRITTDGTWTALTN